MEKRETFAFLRRLLNYTPHKADAVGLTSDTALDFFVADTTLECHRDHLQLDDEHVKGLTLKAPPAQTFAHLLADLHTLPTATIVCLEWQRVPNATMRRDLQRRRRHFFSAKTSLVNYLHPDTRPEEMLVDDSAAATVRELGTCLTALEVEGAFFGQVSLTVLVYDRDPQRVAQSVAACLKVFGTHDASLFEESYNLLNAWLAVIPGNSAYNLRRLPLLHHHYADLSLLFSLHAGDTHVRPSRRPRPRGPRNDARVALPLGACTSPTSATCWRWAAPARARASSSTSSSCRPSSTPRSRSSSILAAATAG